MTFKHLGNFFRRQAGGGGQFLNRGLEIAVIVNVADDQFGNAAAARRSNSVSRTCSISICASDVPAVSESNMNCRFSSSSVESADRRVGLRKMVAPFLIQLHQLVKFRLKIIHRRIAASFPWRRVKIRSSGGSARSATSGASLSSASDVLGSSTSGAVNLFQHGVLLQLLLHQRLKFQRGRLQQGQRLLELRRQHQRLRQSLRKLQALNHSV